VKGKKERERERERERKRGRIKGIQHHVRNGVITKDKSLPENNNACM
jgi:hypothetical protein